MQPCDPGHPPHASNGAGWQHAPTDAQQPAGHLQQAYPQQAYPHASQPGYGYQAGPQPGHPGAWQQSQQGQQTKASSGAPGIIGIVFAVLGAGPLGLAIYNLHQAQRLAVDLDMPKWIRGVAVDANMNRILVFGGAAGFLALVGLVLGLVGRRATAGKIALVLAGLVVAGTAYAQIGRATFDGKLPDGQYERDEPKSDDRRSERDAPRDKGPSANAVPEVTGAPIVNSKQGAFRLGRELGLAALGRARGQQQVGNRLFASAELTAKGLGVTLPLPPVVGSDQTANSADALHYLLDTAGKPVATALSAKHSPAHAAAFELGIKLNLLNLLYLPDDELGRGLGAACERLGQRVGVSASLAPLMAKIKGNQSQSAVGDEAIRVLDVIDKELASAPSAPAAPPPPKRAPQHSLDDRLD
jgi:hypothetical protein